ncbi:response regulator [Dyadobacter subterraneus]|uniref:Response regulator transcription factor n=1 Tax=Dyadobacter subterraneus TaxID=2773304 RepID=A0ABR9W539_9BACT|nr:response regulator transcription factor [Dyadobacter subterraneus]MBE9460574.1 response regulator transcription factor [Dyadobacter subterraneus]
MINTILIADDHCLSRIALNLLVKDIFGNTCVVDFAENGKQVLDKLSSCQFNMLITDLNMPETDCMGMLCKALELVRDLKILVVSVYNESIYAQRCLKVGAYGYLCKNESDDDFKNAIRTVGAGRRYYSFRQNDLFINSFLDGFSDNPFHKLSAREFEVALLLLKGHGAIEVANVMDISPSTASTYRARVFNKLKVKNLMELNHLSSRFGIADDFA